MHVITYMWKKEEEEETVKFRNRKQKSGGQGQGVRESRGMWVKVNKLAVKGKEGPGI